MSKEDQRNFKKLVLEKRSKLNEQENTLSERQEAAVSHSQSRAKKYNKRPFFWKSKRRIGIIALLAVIAGGTFGYIQGEGLLSSTESGMVENSPDKDHQMEPPAEKEIAMETGKLEEKDDPDIRYVTVDSAYVRNNPDMDSEASEIAAFGQTYIVLETYKDPSNDMEWLKITGDPLNEEGWISSKVMFTIDNELDDLAVADKIDNLIGFYPSLDEAIPMLGKDKGGEQSFDYTEYMYLNNQVSGFTITVSDSSKEEVAGELGDPQLEKKDTLLYHGGKYDFIFTVLDDGTINELSVKEI